MTEWVDLMLNSLEVEGTQDVWGIEEYIIKQVEPLRKPVETVTKLDVERYGGRWYQVRTIQAMASALAWPKFGDF